MSKLKISFVTYTSLPKSSLRGDWENYYETILKPFIATLYKYKDQPSVHYIGGESLKWIEKHHPEYISVFTEMIKKKQADILCGAYQEPFLPIIPGPDRLGQIELMSTVLRKSFGKRFRGFWIPELVWDPNLAGMLCRSGVDYTFLPDSDLLQLGISPKSTYQIHNVEDQGKAIKVIPLWRAGRGIGSMSPEEIIGNFLALHQDEARYLALAIDPLELRNKTKHQGQFPWLDRLMTLFREHNQELELVLPNNEIKTENIIYSTHYFSPTTIEQYNSWSNVNNRNYGKGAFKNLINYYKDVRLIYAKMIFVHSLVQQIKGDKSRKKLARELLWKGQIHQAYCSGRLGGVADSHIRREAYASLLEAEKNTREKGIFMPSLMSTDYDLDGRKEFLYQGYDYNGYVHQSGGALFEWDYFPLNWNILNSFRAYSAFEKSIKGKAFHDHFYPMGMVCQEWRDSLDMGDFAYGMYRVIELDKEKNQISMTRRGSLTYKGKTHALKIRKEYHFKRRSIEVVYNLENVSTADLHFQFSPEFNLALSQHDEEHKLFTQKDNQKIYFSEKELVDTSFEEINLQDPQTKAVITVHSSVASKFYLRPIMLPIEDEMGERIIYQSSQLNPYWSLSLLKGKSWNVILDIKVTRR